LCSRVKLIRDLLNVICQHFCHSDCPVVSNLSQLIVKSKNRETDPCLI
jgi:hypothetical protein